jgi:hypothetical protein
MEISADQVAGPVTGSSKRGATTVSRRYLLHPINSHRCHPAWEREFDSSQVKARKALAVRLTISPRNCRVRIIYERHSPISTTLINNRKHSRNARLDV